MSIKDNFTVDAGGTFVRTYVYTTANGTPINLTGYTAKAQVRHSSTAALVFECEPTIDIATAEIEMTWTPTQTQLLTASNYVFGIEVATTNETDVIVLATGVVTVNQEIVK